MPGLEVDSAKITDRCTTKLGSVRVTRQQISVYLTRLERDPANLLKVGVTLRAVVDKAAFLFQRHEESVAVNLLLPRPVGSKRAASDDIQRGDR